MLIDRDGATVRVWAPAKLNLFLEVLGRRPDGYHDLATLMVGVGLYDSLEVREGPVGGVRLRCDHPGLPAGPDNLVVRAAELLRKEAGARAGLEIVLRKRIPLAAGLAGGSSDAAGTLAGVNRLWRLGLTQAELARRGAGLGSDVSFFFYGPAAWCTGRGERVEPLALGAPLHFVLACPPAGLTTATVFAALKVHEPPTDGGGVRRSAAAGDVEGLGRQLFNRLQPVAQGLCPGVRALHDRLAGLGPAGQLMSGSGTTVYALCRDAGEALRVARVLRTAREGGDAPRVCVVRSCD